ncbi:MAG: hypothetical protein J6B88_02215 [Clostridia bacterium]|nr:hypothetical protein [Clostridia bacterium]
MKRFLVVILILALICCFTGCREDSNNSYGDTNYNDKDYEEELPSTSIQYISDREVEYDDTNKYHIVFFGLQDATDTYLSASGTASITITDETDTNLFKKDIPFTSNDFTDWTNQHWDSSRYLCGIYIKDSELQGSASSSGTLSLEVTLADGTHFEAKALNISDLPSISVKVNLPTIPATFKDMRYSSYTSTVQITKLEYKSEVNYDGEATLYFDVILKLVSKTDKINESSNVNLGYKLYDSEGIVVDSGHIYSDPIAVGESSKDSFNIYDLDPRDTYTLKFENAS